MMNMKSRHESLGGRRLFRARGAVCAALALSTIVQGQTSGFQAVDQGFVDISPLTTSLYELRPDVGPPSRFEQVYTHPAYPGMYLRIDGAMIIAFPRSEYVATGDGVVPVAPDNTVFYIGGKPKRFPSEFVIGAGQNPANAENLSPMAINGMRPLRAASLFRSHAAESGAAPDGVFPSDAPHAAPPWGNQSAPVAPLMNEKPSLIRRSTVWSNELYRQSRLAELLADAHARARRPR